MRFFFHFKFLFSNERLDFCNCFKIKIKRINNTDLFSQPPLIIFSKGMNNFEHNCIYVHTHTHIYYYYFCSMVLLDDKLELFNSSNLSTWQSLPNVYCETREQRIRMTPLYEKVYGQSGWSGFVMYAWFKVHLIVSIVLLLLKISSN